MAVLSFANAMTQLSRVVKVINQIDLAIQTNSSGAITNFIALREIIEQALAGDYGLAILDDLGSVQSTLTGLVSESSIQQRLTPPLRDVMLAIGGQPDANFDSMVEQLRDYMAANAQTVLTRAMSYGSVTPDGSNVGGMAGYTLTVDKNGSQLQGAVAESVVIEVVKDHGEEGGSITRNEEELQYRGAAKRDGKTSGSGLSVAIKACYDSANKLTNPRFSSFLGTKPTATNPTTPAAVGNCTGYVLSDVTKFQVGVDYTTRSKAAVDSRARSLVFVGNGNFYQSLTDAGKKFKLGVPYLPAALVQPRSSCDGSITLAWGSHSQSGFSVGALTTDEWAWMIPARDSDLYFDNWKQDNARWTMTMASWTTGLLVVQEVGLYEGQLIDGLWHWVLGDDVVAQRGDFFTFSKGQSSDGINQRIIVGRSGAGRRRGLTLPSAASASETVADA